MLALDPNETCEVKLALETQGRAFLVRYLTCRETTAYKAGLAAAIAEKDDAKSIDLLMDLLRPVVVGWKGCATFTIDQLPAMLTPCEMWELGNRIPEAVAMSELDKKKSYWQSQSAGAKAANTTATADASTPPAQPAP